MHLDAQGSDFFKAATASAAAGGLWLEGLGGLGGGMLVEEQPSVPSHPWRGNTHLPREALLSSVNYASLNGNVLEGCGVLSGDTNLIRHLPPYACSLFFFSPSCRRLQLTPTPKLSSIGTTLAYLRTCSALPRQQRRRHTR